MNTGYLPKAITKDVLFDKARERFNEWFKMFTDPSVSVQWMYNDMSASCYCGNPADDFPDDFKQAPVKISDNEFRYRDITFRITRDGIDDKSYIWTDKYNDSDDLVWWAWGGVSVVNDKWLIEILDKFISSHEEEQDE